jgi:hypothetical protein
MFRPLWAIPSWNKDVYIYRLLVENPEGKRPLGILRHGWVDNIQMNLGEIGWIVMG